MNVRFYSIWRTKLMDHFDMKRKKNINHFHTFNVTFRAKRRIENKAKVRMILLKQWCSSHDCLMFWASKHKTKIYAYNITRTITDTCTWFCGRYYASGTNVVWKKKTKQLCEQVVEQRYSVRFYYWKSLPYEQKKKEPNDRRRNDEWRNG